MSRPKDPALCATSGCRREWDVRLPNGDGLCDRCWDDYCAEDDQRGDYPERDEPGEAWEPHRVVDRDG
jgi:hypothetical protein